MYSFFITTGNARSTPRIGSQIQALSRRGVKVYRAMV